MAEAQKPKEAGIDWIEKIASKSKRNADEVRGTLDRYNIKPRAEIAIPRRLTIRSIILNGQKTVGAQAPISFEWVNLAPGLHAILSGRNLRGKTTLLSIVRWGLTGRRSLPSEMKEWFSSISIGFSLDDRLYDVRLSNAVKSEGKLVRFEGTREIPVREFSSEGEFEEVMSAFFMSELGLERLTNHTVRDGKSVDQDHDWPWLSTAMTIEPDPGALFGSTALAAMPALLAMVPGFLLGCWTATRRGSWSDGAVRVVTVLSFSVPAYWLAVLSLVFIGQRYPDMLPTAGGFVRFTEDPIANLKVMLLPALVLGLSTFALVVRSIRAALIDVLSFDYVAFATAMGMPQRQMMKRIAIRNAIIPTLTVVGVLLGGLVSGTVLVESVFQIPGLGQLMVTAFLRQDYPLALGCSVFTAMIFLGLNLVVDALYFVVDPRTRTSTQRRTAPVMA